MKERILSTKEKALQMLATASIMAQAYLGVPTIARAAEEPSKTVTGTMHVIHGDTYGPRGFEEDERYYLTTKSDTQELKTDDPALEAQFRQVNGQTVDIFSRGNSPKAVILPLGPGAQPAALLTPDRVNLAYFSCRTSDRPELPRFPDYRKLAQDYWNRQFDDNRMQLGEVLNQAHVNAPLSSFKEANGSPKLFELADACIKRNDTEYDLNSYTGFVLFLDAQSMNTSYGGQMVFQIEGQAKLVSIVWVPNINFALNGSMVVGHELGHAIGGLGHSSSEPLGKPYSDRTSPMGDPYAWCSVFFDPTFGCMPQGMSASDKRRMGAGHEYTLLTGDTMTRTLGEHSWFAAKLTNGAEVIVDFRNKETPYDKGFPTSGVVIHTERTDRVDQPWVLKPDSDEFMQSNSTFSYGPITICSYDKGEVAVSYNTKLTCRFEQPTPTPTTPPSEKHTYYMPIIGGNPKNVRRTMPLVLRDN